MTCSQRWMRSPLLEDMSNPQPAYRRMLDQGGVSTPMEGVVVVADRDTVDYVLRHHELFSSEVDMALGNVRPLIPLNVDPPKHSKYRKILDPLFAPQAAWTSGGGHHAAGQRVHRRVRRSRRVQLHRGVRRAVPVVGVPRADGPARGRSSARSSTCATASCIPRRSTPTRCSTPRRGSAVMDAHRPGDLRLLRRAASTSGSANPTDDILTHFLTAEIDGERLTREEILDICFLFLIAGLDTVSDSLTCIFAFLAEHPEHRRQIVDDPAIIPSAVEELLRWETPVPLGVPRMATQDTELPNGVPGPAGHGGHGELRRRQHRPRRVPRRRSTCASTARSTATSPSAAACTAASARTWPAASCASRCASGTAASPTTRIKPGHEELEYPPGLRHVKDLTLAWR